MGSLSSGQARSLKYRQKVIFIVVQHLCAHTQAQIHIRPCNDLASFVGLLCSVVAQDSIPTRYMNMSGHPSGQLSASGKLGLHSNFGKTGDILTSGSL